MNKFTNKDFIRAYDEFKPDESAKTRMLEMAYVKASREPKKRSFLSFSQKNFAAIAGAAAGMIILFGGLAVMLGKETYTNPVDTNTTAESQTASPDPDEDETNKEDIAQTNQEAQDKLAETTKPEETAPEIDAPVPNPPPELISPDPAPAPNPNPAVTAPTIVVPAPPAVTTVPNTAPAVGIPNVPVSPSPDVASTTAPTFTIAPTVPTTTPSDFATAPEATVTAAATAPEIPAPEITAEPPAMTAPDMSEFAPDVTAPNTIVEAAPDVTAPDNMPTTGGNTSNDSSHLKPDDNAFASAPSVTADIDTPNAAPETSKFTPPFENFVEDYGDNYSIAQKESDKQRYLDFMVSYWANELLNESYSEVNLKWISENVGFWRSKTTANLELWYVGNYNGHDILVFTDDESIRVQEWVQTLKIGEFFIGFTAGSPHQYHMVTATGAGESRAFVDIATAYNQKLISQEDVQDLISKVNYYLY